MNQEISIDALRARVHAKIDEALDVVALWVAKTDEADPATRQRRIDDPVAVQSVLAVALAPYVYERERKDAEDYERKHKQHWDEELEDLWWHCSEWRDGQPPEPLLELAFAVVDRGLIET